MKRRGFLKLLGLLPLAPALAEAAAKTIKPNQIFDLGPLPGKETLLDVANRYKNDLYLPVVEALNQKNLLLQDTVWRERWLPIRVMSVGELVEGFVP